jgi:hypothetical protein
MIDRIKRESSKWCPLYVLPRNKKKAFAALANKDMTVYLPSGRQLVQWSSQKTWTDELCLKPRFFVRFKQRDQAESLKAEGYLVSCLPRQPLTRRWKALTVPTLFHWRPCMWIKSTILRPM